MLVNNRKLTTKELSEELNIAYGSFQDIVVNDLGLRGVAAKLVLKNLNLMHAFVKFLIQNKKTPRECLRLNDGTVPTECQVLRNTFFECKRSLLDARQRFRGRKGY